MECQSEKPRKKGFTVPSKSTNIPSKKDTNESKQETTLKCAKDQDQENKKTKKTNIVHGHKLKETDILKDTQNKGNKLASSLTDQEYEEIFKCVLKESESDGVLKESESEGKAKVKQSGDKKQKPNKIKAELLRDQEKIPKKTRTETLEDLKERPKKTKEKQMLSQDGKHNEIKEKQLGEQGRKKIQVRAKKSASPKEKTMKIKAKDKQDSMIISMEDDGEEKGTWIQCTNSWCNKWRYVPDIADPISVPELWECSMNPDALHKSCNDEEEEYDESEQILTKYTPGSLVWGKMGGFPWWPAMVESDPDYDLYFELPNEESMNPSKFHVTFFGKRVSRAWIKATHILPYTKTMPAECRLTKKCSSLLLEMDVAVKDVQVALSMSLKARLLKYGFSGRYSSKLKTTEADTYEYDDSENEDRKDKDNFSGNPGKKRKVSKKHSASFPRKTNCSAVKPEIADSTCLDQHVPDIIEPILEEEISMDFSVNDECDSIKPEVKVNCLKKLSKNNDIDDIATEKCTSKESLLSADPVPDIDDDRDTNPKDKDGLQFDLDLKDESTNSEDKWRYGHFMGHCSDHGSDSDPLDIIED